MATAQALITTVKNNYAPKIGRTIILSCLNRAVRALFNQDCAQTTYYNDSDDTFPFPFLSTTDGTLSYEIATSLVDSDGTSVTPAVNSVTVTPRRVKRVFISSASMRTGEYSPNFRGESFSVTSVNPHWSVRPYYGTYTMVVGMPVDKTDTQAAKFVFAENPGTHDDFFYAEFYYEHPELEDATGSTGTFLFDSNRWEQALIDGTVGFIEDFQHGESRRMERFFTHWAEKFKGEQNKGADQRRPAKFPVRECL
ncbi:MAG: hypothetical protein ABIH23_04305 [bacterium]